ncbi:hypothetical protein SLEP1_g55208 [Rubroshorea leprosula]|uniref:MPBQ/MBSQ family SAM-binding methyltransferase profile domain-containing protein n=1 Tax=Rubroshorea leprosula TaxID=152421 RepID=A0AAV5MH66_9ROSI|nr:hypothetical protein SLEP1_g55208 [Rubroshorea leprosula]
MGSNSQKTRIFVPRCSISARSASQPRFIQHKQEAFWFYRFLSIVYDHIINPFHCTEDMRDEALEPVDLYDRNMTVVDVGGGTGLIYHPCMWMIFPKEEEYVEWLQKAGFKDVQLKRIGPKWYRGSAGMA